MLSILARLSTGMLMHQYLGANTRERTKNNANIAFLAEVLWSDITFTAINAVM